MPAQSALLTPREQADVTRANTTGRPPLVFVHGLWLLAGSWDPWRTFFEEHGYSTLAPGWPDDPETVAEGRAKPALFAGKSVGDVTDHFAAVLRQLTQQPALIGHSFGGLISQKLAGQGLAAATVVIDPAPFRGVLPLPRSALKAAWPVLRNPANRTRAVMLTYDQFRFAFANAVSEAEAQQLYDTFPVPGSGIPLFQAAFANLNPATEAKVATTHPARGPLKFLSGKRDNTVPWAITNASYHRQRHNHASTEIQEVPGRGHSLVIDRGWPEVAQLALEFLQRQRP